MAYKNMLLPKAVDLEWVSGVGFSTSVVRMDNGRESRNQDLDSTLARYVLRYNVRKQDIWEEIDAFFQVAAGRAHAWRLWDPKHNYATATQGVVVSNQMYVRYTFGAYSFDRKITKPDASVTLIGGGSFDPATGIVTGGATGWFGTFYICCRFDTDDLELSGVDRSINDGTFLAGYRDVPIVEDPFS